MNLEALILYLETHPLVAVLLVVIVVLCLSSLIRRLVRLALMLGAIFLVVLYFTHRQAEQDWRAQAELMKRKAAEYGEQALEKGKELIEKGRKELEKKLSEEQGE